MTQINSTQSQENFEEKYGHFLQPIRDLADNWNIDLAASLAEFMEEMQSISFKMDDRQFSCFVQAALLIQGSAHVYGRKVEYLYKIVNNVIEAVQNTRQRKSRKAKDTGQNEDDTTEFDFESWMNMQLPLDNKAQPYEQWMTPEANYKQFINQEHNQTTPSLLQVLEDTDFTSQPQIDDFGAYVQSMNSYLICRSQLHSSGALVLDSTYMPLLDDMFNISKQRQARDTCTARKPRSTSKLQHAVTPQRLNMPHSPVPPHQQRAGDVACVANGAQGPATSDTIAPPCTLPLPNSPIPTPLNPPQHIGPVPGATDAHADVSMTARDGMDGALDDAPDTCAHDDGPLQRSSGDEGHVQLRTRGGVEGDVAADSGLDDGGEDEWECEDEFELLDPDSVGLQHKQKRCKPWTASNRLQVKYRQGSSEHEPFGFPVRYTSALAAKLPVKYGGELGGASGSSLEPWQVVVRDTLPGAYIGRGKAPVLYMVDDVGKETLRLLRQQRLKTTQKVGLEHVEGMGGQGTGADVDQLSGYDEGGQGDDGAGGNECVDCDDDLGDGFLGFGVSVGDLDCVDMQAEHDREQREHLEALLDKGDTDNGYQQLLRQRMEELMAEAQANLVLSDIDEKVAAWKAKVCPLLQRDDESFDLRYEAELALKQMASMSCTGLSDLSPSASLTDYAAAAPQLPTSTLLTLPSTLQPKLHIEPHRAVARRFAALLQLSNDQNIQIIRDSDPESGVDRMDVDGEDSAAGLDVELMGFKLQLMNLEMPDKEKTLKDNTVAMDAGDAAEFMKISAREDRPKAAVKHKKQVKRQKVKS